MFYSVENQRNFKKMKRQPTEGESILLGIVLVVSYALIYSIITHVFTN